jgi:hypothetical protein
VKKSKRFQRQSHRQLTRPMTIVQALGRHNLCVLVWHKFQSLIDLAVYAGLVIAESLWVFVIVRFLCVAYEECDQGRWIR